MMTRQQRSLRPLLLLTALAVAAGCDEALSNLTGPTPNLVPTFASVQREIFEAPDQSGRPACTSCHNATLSRFNGLDLSHDVAYANLVNAASRSKSGAIRVIPGDPANSYVIQKLEGAAGIVGARMPFNGPYLSPGQIAVIRRWIENGAAQD
jgi:hypothetical protein